MHSDPGVVFFDVDGVLVDSLAAHLEMCKDKAADFGLNINVPTVDDFRSIIRSGATISPMREFFITLGFPPDLASIAVCDYEDNFIRLYKPNTYPNVKYALARLRQHGWTLGIVTSNILKNIKYSLGKEIELFDPRCIFTLDSAEERREKSSYLIEGASILKRRPADCFYVGDLPSDAQAASRADFVFVAAGYGWGFAPDTRARYWIEDIEELPDLLRGGDAMGGISHVRDFRRQSNRGESY